MRRFTGHTGWPGPPRPWCMRSTNRRVIRVQNSHSPNWAPPTADRRVVCDLRADWPTALGAAGSDPAHRVELKRLLTSLHRKKRRTLVDNVTALSVPDSQVCSQGIRNFKPHREERMRSADDPRQSLARSFDLDMNELGGAGDHREPASYLSDNGWLLTEIKSQDLLTANGFQPFEVGAVA